jgi:hypothetical protein
MIEPGLEILGVEDSPARRAVFFGALGTLAQRENEPFTIVE